MSVETEHNTWNTVMKYKANFFLYNSFTFTYHSHSMAFVPTRGEAGILPSDWLTGPLLLELQLQTTLRLLFVLKATSKAYRH